MAILASGLQWAETAVNRDITMKPLSRKPIDIKSLFISFSDGENKQAELSEQREVVCDIARYFINLQMYFDCHTTEDETGEGNNIFAKVVLLTPTSDLTTSDLES